MPSLFKLLCATVLLLASTPTFVHAEQFDTAYSDDGRYTESTGGGNRTALAMLEAPTGEVVQVSSVSGGCGGSPVCPRLTYLTANGVYVLSYGIALSSSNGLESATAAAIDSRGRIIVVGTSTPSVGGRNFRVLRFLPNGDLDTSFAGDGNTDVDFFGVDDYATAVAVDAHDNVIGCRPGGALGNRYGFRVARPAGTDGAPDPVFPQMARPPCSFDLGATQNSTLPKAVAIAARRSHRVAGIAYYSAINRYRVA